MGTRARLLPWVVLAMLLATSCGGGLARRGAATATPTPAAQADRQVGSLDLDDLDGEEASDAGTASDAPAAGSPGQGFVLVLRDQNGNSPAGIPVEIRGTRSMDLVSDATGRVVVTGPSGYYTFKVPVRCYETLHVEAGGTGRFGIADGQSGTGEVQVHWQHRYGPWPPAYSSVAPYWPVGETVRIRYDVMDRCPDGARATDRAIPSYRFQTNDVLELVGTPELRSDRNGYAWVEARCRTEGRPELVVFDAENPSDRVDLVDADVSSPQRPSCRRV